MTPNEVCADIIRTVNASNLNFQVNETPYSVYFTIRKKFLKDRQSGRLNLEAVAQSKAFENENKHLRIEYEKLYELYKTTFEKNVHLVSEVVKFDSQLQQNRKELEQENKGLKREKKIIEEKFETLRELNVEFTDEIKVLNR